MVKIVWTAEALAWLREIHDHIAIDNRDAARRVVQGLISRVEQLQLFPESGAMIEDPGGGRLRMILYGHYRIVYRLRSEESVEIIGIYHGALDIARRLAESNNGSDTVHE